ncbi:MAG: protein-L-isoaspartate(D-aspartate) O-methyltransferase [Deltaproteobacteria bacterium]|nr:protein-L-isoaspartate(D-aspartate) O-methyltransferase [Deltaproteobacteria bacterium]MBW2218601.1 protein-L-isoaspartate(D-aspartate) O-methyltransferase [Deltaproteobacteria bacterium]
MKTLILFTKCILLLFAGFGWPSVSYAENKQISDQFRTARELMVKNQIKARGVTDKRVLTALQKIERHRFVPAKYRNQAYEDHPLPIGEGQTISQPYIVGLMTSLVEPDNTIKVLEIGTGSGYQAAVLAEICKFVYTIEVIPSLGKKAKLLLNDLKYKNIKVKIGDGYKGWKEFAPFDAIVVTCAPSHVPEPLKQQLKEGGRIVIPVGEKFMQYLKVLTKKEGKIIEDSIIPVRFVPMIDQEGKKY